MVHLDFFDNYGQERKTKLKNKSSSSSNLKKEIKPNRLGKEVCNDKSIEHKIEVIVLRFCSKKHDFQ